MTDFYRLVVDLTRENSNPKRIKEKFLENLKQNIVSDATKGNCATFLSFKPNDENYDVIALYVTDELKTDLPGFDIETEKTDKSLNVEIYWDDE